MVNLLWTISDISFRAEVAVIENITSKSPVNHSRLKEMFKARILHCKVIPDRGQPGQMRWILLWTMPQVQDWLLNLPDLQSNALPLCYGCSPSPFSLEITVQQEDHSRAWTSQGQGHDKLRIWQESIWTAIVSQSMDFWVSSRISTLYWDNTGWMQLIELAWEKIGWWGKYGCLDWVIETNSG